MTFKANRSNGRLRRPLSFGVDRLLDRHSNGGSWPGLPVRGQAWQRSLVMYRIEGPLSTTMTIASRP